MGVSLHAKMAAAQAAIGAMPRTGQATVETRSGGRYSYDYLTEDDLMAAVRKELSAKGVATYVSVVKQWEEEGATRVMLAVTFTDSESGESFTVNGQGAGADKGDKGVYKAITGATRYVLWKTMLVSTGDDHEAEANPTTRAEHAAEARRSRSNSQEGEAERSLSSEAEKPSEEQRERAREVISRYSATRGVTEEEARRIIREETGFQSWAQASAEDVERAVEVGANLLQLEEVPF